MSKVDFDLNLPGLNALMKSPEMQAILSEKGQKIMNAANASSEDQNAKYSTSTKTLNWLAVADVRCDNSEAIQENLKNNTLLKAMGGSK